MEQDMEKRIYVVIPARVRILTDANPALRKYVEQPIGRQVAQACHVVSKLRHFWDRMSIAKAAFEPITTIILQARDTEELTHIFDLLVSKKSLSPALFSDENEQAYGTFHPVTALAVLATKKQIEGILDYLPLWG